MMPWSVAAIAIGAAVLVVFMVVRGWHAARVELAAIHANAPMTILVLDGELRAREPNGGRRPGDAIGCLNALADPRGCGYGEACGECAIRRAALDTLRTGARHDGVEAWVPRSIDGKVERRCLLLYTSPLQLGGGRHALVCAQDITGRKLAAAEMELQAELIDLSHDAIIRTDANGAIRAWNRGAEETYGWTEAEALGQAIAELLRTKPGRRESELMHTRRDGHEVAVESRRVLVRSESGAPAGILEINRDVTERMRTQEQLLEAHRRTTAILESLSDGFNVFDRQWRYTYVNATAARMVHKRPEELLGKSVWELWPHAADSPFGVAYRRSVAENVPVQVEAFYPEPLNRWFEVRCYPSPEGLSLFFADTTERKRAEEKLRATVRELEAALAERTVLLKEIHHRVKNNLAVISSLLSMKADTTGNAEAKRALEESRERVQSMALIHEHLCGSGRLDRINFSEYAEVLVNGLYPAFVEMHLQPVELGIERAVPCALILNELLSNAFKYAFPEGRSGRVAVSFRAAESGELELAVEDDGVGLPAGSLGGSAGSLGLRIVGILARQLDGTIEQEACAGTRIVLRFPVVKGVLDAETRGRGDTREEDKERVKTRERRGRGEEGSRGGTSAAGV